MSTGYHPEDHSAEEMSTLPPLKWSRDTFDGFVNNFKFPASLGATYPEEGQTTVDALADFITLFWDFFTEGNFRLRVTRFVLDTLDFYKFHISQLNPMGMVRIRHLEFICRSMYIEPTVDRFRVFYQLQCSQGFYSFFQRISAKKILLSPPKSFHEWKRKFFFIKAGVIPQKMIFRGPEDIPVETIKTPSFEVWYQDLKDVPSIELPERALVGAGMSLHWKADRDDKPVYVEDDKSKAQGNMETVKMGAIEEPWYQQIVRNFALPKDADLSAQSTYDVGPSKEEKKKGTHLISDPWGDYVVVFDTLEGLAPVALKKPKPEPQDTADIPASNPDEPIDLDSSPEPLLRTKAAKRKQPEGGAAAQPMKKTKKIGKRGDLDAFVAKSSPEKGKSTQEDPMITVPSSTTTSAPQDDVDKSPPGADRGFIYRKRASEIYAPVWKVKQGDTYSDWQVCRDWLQGIFPPAEAKVQEGRSHDKTYHSYLEEIASSTSTIHTIVREWRSMHKERDVLKRQKRKLLRRRRRLPC
ncbi:hypothetical protein Hanom_Chr11g01063511 [Helianthus anomalus]